MQSPIDQLKERILNKKGKNKETELTSVLDMVREFSCLGDVLGRDFEVENQMGKVVYRIHQKPIAIKQLKILLREFEILKIKDNERQSAMFGKKGSKSMGRKK